MTILFNPSDFLAEPQSCTPHLGKKIFGSKRGGYRGCRSGRSVNAATRGVGRLLSALRRFRSLHAQLPHIGPSWRKPSTGTDNLAQRTTSLGIGKRLGKFTISTVTRYAPGAGLANVAPLEITGKESREGARGEWSPDAP